MDVNVTGEVDEYRRSLEAMKTEHQAAALRAKKAMVGHYFKAIERLASDPSQSWPVYIVIERMDEEARLVGWYFQLTATGDAQVRQADDLQAGFLAEHCAEVERGEFVAAFNELLTHIARYATRMPMR